MMRLRTNLVFLCGWELSAHVMDVTIEYFDENFKKHTETFTGVIARVIQHEYDHIEGILFTDKINPFKRKLIAGKLTDISKGKFKADYKTRVYQPKR